MTITNTKFIIGANTRFIIRGEYNDQGEHKVRPYGTRPDSLGRVVQGFKSKTTHEYIGGVKQMGWTPFSGKLWQRNYYDHIVRNDEELNRIREYISDNPRRWDMDRENPEGPNYQNKSETAESYNFEKWNAIDSYTSLLTM